jgi:hypothetical protein
MLKFSKKVDFKQALSYIVFKALTHGLKSGLSCKIPTALMIKSFKNDCLREPGGWF